MPGQFISPEGDLELIFVDDYNLIDQYAATGSLWMFGKNTYGNLGDNSVAHKSSPVQTVSGGTNWKQVASSTYNTAAIKTNGELWLWGRNSYGQLGDNSRNDASSPVQTVSSGTNWKQVAFGRNHVGAVKTDGTLWMWGDNGGPAQTGNGRLGDNTNIDTSSPVQTVSGGTNWKLVYCGNYHTAALKNDGTLWLWGNGGYGQLGNNDSTGRSSPVQTVSSGTNWKQAVCGIDGVLAIREDYY